MSFIVIKASALSQMETWSASFVVSTKNIEIDFEKANALISSGKISPLDISKNNLPPGITANDVSLMIKSVKAGEIIGGKKIIQCLSLLWFVEQNKDLTIKIESKISSIVYQLENEHIDSSKLDPKDYCSEDNYVVPDSFQSGYLEVYKGLDNNWNFHSRKLLTAGDYFAICEDFSNGSYQGFKTKGEANNFCFSITQAEESKRGAERKSAADALLAKENPVERLKVIS